MKFIIDSEDTLQTFITNVCKLAHIFGDGRDENISRHDYVSCCIAMQLLDPFFDYEEWKKYKYELRHGLNQRIIDLRGFHAAGLLETDEEIAKGQKSIDWSKSE